MELQCVYSRLPLLNSKNLGSQNRPRTNQPATLPVKIEEAKSVMDTMNIQQKFLLGPNEYLHMLIKNNYEEWFKT